MGSLIVSQYFSLLCQAGCLSEITGSNRQTDDFRSKIDCLAVDKKGGLL